MLTTQCILSSTTLLTAELVICSCSMGSTKIDFTALDLHKQSCHGLCGDRVAILKYLREVGALNSPQSAPDSINLAASERGIYGITVTESGGSSSSGPVSSGISRKLYVVMWPRNEGETDIRPASTTTTLMRYLTQLCNEVS